MTLADLQSPSAEAMFDWPLFGLQDDVRPALADARDRKRPFVLATLHQVVGGAPRGIGAQMAFVDGQPIGFMSGGCVEADIALHARNVLMTRRPKRLVYGDSGPWDVRLPCGSRIDLLLERVGPDDEALQRLLQLSEARRPALWLTNGVVRWCASPCDLGVVPADLQPIANLAATAADVCGTATSPFTIFRAYAPAVRLIAVGSDPTAMAVVRLASEMGLDTVLVRPNGPEACPLRKVLYFRTAVEEVLSLLKPDRWSAITLLTHDPELENLALKAALRSDANYIGTLGSRRRIPERIRQLKLAGFDDADIGRIKAPIGLPIGGKSPWEIAVSVIAQVVNEMRREAPGGSKPRAP